MLVCGNRFIQPRHRKPGKAPSTWQRKVCQKRRSFLGMSTWVVLYGLHYERGDDTDWPKVLYGMPAFGMKTMHGKSMGTKHTYSAKIQIPVNLYKSRYNPFFWVFPSEFFANEDMGVATLPNVAISKEIWQEKAKLLAEAEDKVRSILHAADSSVSGGIHSRLHLCLCHSIRATNREKFWTYMYTLQKEPAHHCVCKTGF